jgi:guanidinopropionase
MTQEPWTDEEFEKAKAESTPWYWWGIPTLFRCPWDENPANCDIALVGVPHSSGNGSTERDQHLGPRAVRHVSGFYRRAHFEHQIVAWDECRINDLGDVPLPQAMVNDISVLDIERYYRRLEIHGTRPVSIGGDHSITGPILKAIAGSHSRLTGGRKAALVHFDAHTDSFDQLPHWLGSVRSAAHWASYLVVENHVDSSKSVQIGIRGNPPTLDFRKSSYDLDYRVVTFKEFEELGIERTIRLVRERVGDSPIYVTFDLDCLDPSVAPAAANLEPSTGMTMQQVTSILHGLRGLDVIGGDVVCLVPTKDNPNNITALNSMVVMFEILNLVAYRLRDTKRATAAGPAAA